VKPPRKEVSKRMRPKRYSKKSTQVRLNRLTELKLEDLAKRCGVDKSTIMRLALNTGLMSLSKNLPILPK